MKNQLHFSYLLWTQGFTLHIHGHKQYFSKPLYSWHQLPEPHILNQNTKNKIIKVLTETMQFPVTPATESLNLKI